MHGRRRAEVTPHTLVGAVFCVARTARSVSHVSERQRYVIEYFACSYSLFIHTRTLRVSYHHSNVRPFRIRSATFPTRCYSNYASSSPSSNSTIALSAASCSVFRCFLRALFSLDFRSSRTALRAPPPACVGETRVVFILSTLTAREVANSVVGSSQLVAPLLSDQLIGVAQAHAEHRLDLVAECGTTASSAPPPASRAWRRCCLLRFGTCSEHTWCGART